VPCADADRSDHGSGRSAIVPSVQRPVLHDDIAGIQDHFTVIEFKANGALQDDVEVQRRGDVHPWTCRVSELRHALGNERIQAAGGWPVPLPSRTDRQIWRARRRVREPPTISRLPCRR
jgi:hypothetical protein